MIKMEGFFKHNKIPELEIILFLRQFAVLITAGVPIIRSCDVLIQSQTNAHMRALLQGLKSSLLSGKPLHSYLSQHPTHFSVLVCRLIQISEMTGRLDTMLGIVAAYLENQRLLKKQLHRALFYPCVIALMGFFTMLSMLIFIIPRFADLFQGSDHPLPFLTNCLFSISYFLNQHIFLFSGSFLTGSLLLLRQPTRQTMTLFFKKHSSNLPLLKPCLTQLALARFSRNLSMTLSAGIPINDALLISSSASNNNSITQLASYLIHKVNSGLTLHRAMGSTFPPFMSQLVEIGEESGKLPQMLDKIAEFYESDASHAISRLCQLLEPLIMVWLGVLIGGMVICVYLPIFNLGNTF